MVKVRELVKCDDCPDRTGLCDTEANKCDLARYVAKVVAEAPPLTPEQIAKIRALLWGDWRR